MPNVTEYMKDYLRKDEKCFDNGAKIIGVLRDAGTPSEGKYGDQLIFKVEMPDRSIKLWTPNGESFKRCQEKWGIMSERWVGLEVEFSTQIINGKVILVGEPFKAMTA